MSILTLQIGQCGNQVGQALYECIASQMINSSPASQSVAGEVFFDYDEKNKKYEAKSLLVDMEPKVINECLISKKLEGLWDYNKNFTFAKQEGSGNNWAYGYNIHGPACKEDILTKFTTLLEKTDYVDAVILFQSLAGGTGSGVGSYLLQTIREEYPDLVIANIAIAPHLTGEVIVQNYNTILTLSNLYDNSDGIFIIENDLLNLICKTLLHLKKPGLKDMNRVLANMLCSVFYPVLPNSNGSYYSSLQNNLKLSEVLTGMLVCNPSYKLLTLKNVPQMPESYKDFSNDTWQGLEKRIFQMLVANCSEADINWSVTTKSKNFNKSISNLLIARGDKVDEQKFDLITSKEFYSQKISNRYSLIKDANNFLNNDKSMSLLSNSQAFVTPLETISNNATRMLHAKAYVYQYEKSKLSVDEFTEALAKVEQIHHNYLEI
jgi:tubulin delta